MPRKQEPTVIAVLDYFEKAPLEAAKLALQLAGRAIRQREPKAKPDKPAKEPAAGQPAQARAPRRAAGTTQAPPAGAPPVGADTPAAPQG
jgi:hypothetical protein